MSYKLGLPPKNWSICCVRIWVKNLMIRGGDGLTGFFATFLLVYVLGGLFLLIDDMDRPLDFGGDSLISVRLDPLLQFNDKLK